MTKMTSESTFKIVPGMIIRPLGTPWGHLGSLSVLQVLKLTFMILAVDLGAYKFNVWSTISASISTLRASEKLSRLHVFRRKTQSESAILERTFAPPK